MFARGGDPMAQLAGKQRITLRQLTRELQQLAAERIDPREDQSSTRPKTEPEDPVASHVALGMAKHRTSQ
jgi:hypothetical protein